MEFREERSICRFVGEGRDLCLNVCGSSEKVLFGFGLEMWLGAGLEQGA